MGGYLLLCPQRLERCLAPRKKTFIVVSVVNQPCETPSVGGGGLHTHRQVLDPCGGWGFRSPPTLQIPRGGLSPAGTSLPGPRQRQ